MMAAGPVAGSSRLTLLASLFANSIVPASPAMMPSALLPSHDHTTFQACPAAITPGIAVVGAGWRSGGGGGVLARPPPPMAKGCGRVAHLASTAGRPGFCPVCWLLARAEGGAGGR